MLTDDPRHAEDMVKEESGDERGMRVADAGRESGLAARANEHRAAVQRGAGLPPHEQANGQGLSAPEKIGEIDVIHAPELVIEYGFAEPADEGVVVYTGEWGSRRATSKVYECWGFASHMGGGALYRGQGKRLCTRQPATARAFGSCCTT